MVIKLLPSNHWGNFKTRDYIYRFEGDIPTGTEGYIISNFIEIGIGQQMFVGLIEGELYLFRAEAEVFKQKGDGFSFTHNYATVTKIPQKGHIYEIEITEENKYFVLALLKKALP